MINAEKYQNELKEIGEYFAVSKNGKMSHCSYSLCKECIFAKDNDCRTNAFNWLLEEYKEPIKLTRFEYEFLKEFTCNVAFLVRNKDGSLRLYSNRPNKDYGGGIWIDPNGGGYFVLNDSSLFSFVNWENGVVMGVDDILDNCEVLEDE